MSIILPGMTEDGARVVLNTVTEQESLVGEFDTRLLGCNETLTVCVGEFVIFRGGQSKLGHYTGGLMSRK